MLGDRYRLSGVLTEKLPTAQFMTNVDCETAKGGSRSVEQNIVHLCSAFCASSDSVFIFAHQVGSRGMGFAKSVSPAGARIA